MANDVVDAGAPVYGWFTEGFDTRDLKEAKALLEKLTTRCVNQRTQSSQNTGCYACQKGFWISLNASIRVIPISAKSRCNISFHLNV
jgi:hypothetical protein